MKFNICDLNFGVSKAIYWGVLREGGLHWALSIQGGGNSHLEIEPRAYSERLFGLDSKSPQTLCSWINKKIGWRSCYIEKTGSYHARMYGFEHADIYNAELSLTVSNGLDAYVKWEGCCDLFIDERYDKNLPFSIEAAITFAGIRVKMDHPEDAQKALEYWITDAEKYKFRSTDSNQHLSGIVLEPTT